MIIVSVIIMIIPTFFTKGVSRIVIEKEINLPLVLNDDKNTKIVFFGYSGCTDICAPRLDSLSIFFKSLPTELKEKVGLEFLDISLPIDNTLPQRFAEHFNNDFKGIYLAQDTLREYTRAFDVYFSQSLIDQYEFDHTSHIYLVTKKNNIKKIRYIYHAFPYDYEQIKKDIKGLINEQ